MLFEFSAFTNADITCTMNYKSSSSSSSYSSLATFTDSTSFASSLYSFGAIDPRLTQTIKFYIQVTDNHPGTPNILIDPVEMQLVVICDANSYELDTFTVNPSTDLFVKDLSDSSNLVFSLNGVVNKVTGCPVL